jgi:hypothetical protein
VSGVASWGETPRPSASDRLDRYFEACCVIESVHEQALLDHAEKVERFLLARIASKEEVGRVVPDRMLENLEMIRERIEWLTRRIEEIDGDV